MTIIQTLQQIKTSMVAAIESALQITLPVKGKNVLRVLSEVESGMFKLLYLVLGNLQKNIFVDTAESESVGGTLERFGRVKLGRNPFPATAGVYGVTVTGAVGAVIPSDTTFISDDDSENPGFLFILDNDFTFLAPTQVIVLRALTPGLESLLAVTNTLTATAPIANVNSGPACAVVSTVNTIPLAAEDLEDYRQKILFSYRVETQGGAATDFRLWAQDVQGILRVYPYATNGQTAQVDIYVEATIADSIDGKGTPTAALMAAYAAVVEFSPDITLPLVERGRRPMGIWQINYFNITPKNIDITISNFIGLTPAIQASIFNTIFAALRITRPYVAAADLVTDQNNIIDTNKLIALIFTAKPGAQFNTVIFTVSGVQVPSYTLINGFIPYLNSINYV